MIGSSKLTTYVLASLLIGCICWTSSVSGEGCNTTELSIIEECISSYKFTLSSNFGTSGTCNRNLMTQDMCSNYGHIITCVNGASLSTTCRPYTIAQMDAILGISCKVNDFAVTCTSAQKINEGQGCTTAELTAIRQCISPYKSTLTSYFGTSGTCNRNLMTQDVCSNYGTVVTCVNNASLSTTTCRPYMVSNMDSELGISCKVNDFAVTCTSASKLNEGTSGASCLSSTGAHAILVAMVTHVILAVFVFPVRNS